MAGTGGTSRGEDVLITVEGTVKARLTKAEDQSPEEVAVKAGLRVAL